MLCRLYTIFDYYFRIKIVVQQHTVHSWRCATTCEHRPTKQTLLVAIFHSFPNSPLSIRSIHIQICRTAAYNVLYTAMLYALWFCYHILQYECMFSFASVLLNRKIVHATASDSHCHIYTFNCIRHWYYCFFFLHNFHTIFSTLSDHLWLHWHRRLLLILLLLL